ncbi:uncharacterized protein [Porites lutea]|uniref:uncharacterized protein n=1 Tax=Porites lutea TaxID=51062 RepID=UPI003CC60DFD
MEKTYFNVAAIVFIGVFSSIYSQDICPSGPLMLASVGDNVTLCWQITAEINELEKYLRLFTVLALIRPGQVQMQKVASANQNGTFVRTYESYHLGLYKDRVTVDADLQAGKLFLRITNYTNQMENVYCVLYEMTIINDVRSCFANAVILRTKVAGPDLPTGSYVNSTASAMNSTETPQSTEGETEIRTGEDYRTELIIVSTVLGVFLVAVVCFVVWNKRREDARESSIQQKKTIDFTAGPTSNPPLKNNNLV